MNRVTAGVLVAMGWYATLIAALFVAVSGLPATPRTGCGEVFSCLTPAQSLGLAAGVVAVPVLAGLMISTVIITGLLARRIASAIAVGTLAALGSIAIVSACGAALVASR
jgi:hypothetical protein